MPDQLGIVDDAHEFARGAGEDLLPGQRAAAAFDQLQMLGGLVCAVDVDVDVADRIQCRHFEAVSSSSSVVALELETTASMPVAHGSGKQVDQEIDR